MTCAHLESIATLGSPRQACRSAALPIGADPGHAGRTRNVLAVRFRRFAPSAAPRVAPLLVARSPRADYFRSIYYNGPPSSRRLRPTVM